MRTIGKTFKSDFLSAEDEFKVDYEPDEVITPIEDGEASDSHESEAPPAEEKPKRGRSKPSEVKEE